MRLEIEVNGSMHEVMIEAVTERPNHFAVSWAGVRHEINTCVVARDRYGVVLSLIKADEDARSFQARCSPLDRDGAMIVRMNGVEHNILINGSRSRVATADSSESHGGRLVAPMPGKVVRVLVAPGDEVDAHQQIAQGDGIVVVEAMKMENELTAVCAGTVIDVAVSEGDSVESGRLLVVIE